jgi:muconolactone D-isomerase
MEFLVHIEVDLPPGFPVEEEEEALRAAEADRGRQLIADGQLVRIWRRPGRRANVSLYEAKDATELHDLLSSLPLWPWMNIRVEPLATHPLELDAD